MVESAAGQVSIPEKRETPFEDTVTIGGKKTSIGVSIPEKRETPFEVTCVARVYFLS